MSKIEAWRLVDLTLHRRGVVSQPNLQQAGLNRPLSIDRIKGAQELTGAGYGVV